MRKLKMVAGTVFTLFMANAQSMELLLEGVKYQVPDSPVEMRVGYDGEIALRYGQGGVASIVSLKKVDNIPGWNCSAKEMMGSLFDGGKYGCDPNEVKKMKELLVNGREIESQDTSSEKKIISCGKGGCVSVRIFKNGMVQMIEGSKMNKKTIKKAVGIER